MATPGMLVKVIAEELGESVPTVTQHDRNLAIAGLRTMAGQGKAAARVTPIDSARLFASVLGSRHVKDGVDTVRRYSATLPNIDGDEKPFHNTKIPGLADLPDNHSFIDALAAIIAAAAKGQLAPYLEPAYISEWLKVAMWTPNTNGSIKIVGPHGTSTDCTVTYFRSYSGLPRPAGAARFDRKSYKRWSAAEEEARLAQGIELPGRGRKQTYTETQAHAFFALGNLLRETGKTNDLPKLGARMEHQALWERGFAVLSFAEATRFRAIKIKLDSGADLSAGQRAFLDALEVKYSIPPRFRAPRK
jgi:hypothetical protein